MKNRKTILLVEDDAIIAMKEANDLKKEGYTVIIATNGLEAIEAVKANPDDIELILMDIDLGRGMDGTEAARAILIDHDIPILFLTSHTEKKIIDKAEKITSYGFVVKNTGITMLTASIKMAFRLHEANRHIMEKNREIEAGYKKLQTAIEALSLSKSELQEKSDENEKKYVQLGMAQCAGRIGSYDLNLITGEGSCSDEFCDIHGVQHNESQWAFEEWKTFILPEDLQHVLVDFKNVIKKGENVSSAFRIKRRDNGEVRWVEVRGKVLYDNKHKPLRMIGIIIDVTDRKKAEETLKRSEETYRFLFNNVPIGIGIADTQGLAIDCNSFFEEITGYLVSETKGQSIGFAYRDQSDREENASILKKEGKIRDRETFFIRKDGSCYCALLNVDAMTLHGQNVLLITMRDITDKKRAEELLRESEMRYRALVENSLIGIGIASNDRIVFANQALLKMHGYDDFEDFSLRMPTDYLTPESREILALRKRRKAAGEPVSHEYDLDIIRKDGEIRNMHITSSLVTEHNKKLLYVSFADITDHKKAEEKLKNSVREKEILMREMQHRVKNNLTLVSSLLSISMRKITDEISRKAFQESIDRIKSISVIHEKLYQSTDYEKINLGQHIEDIAQSLMSTYAPNGTIRMSTNIIAADIGIRQAVPLSLILNELITNAIKHAQEPGKNGEILIELHKVGNRLVLTVSDDGKGLPAGFSLKEYTGMGLHIVDLLASQINGEFSIQNGARGVIARITFESTENK